MRATHRRLLLGGLLLVAGMVVLPAQSQATPASGVTGSPPVRASFTDDVSVKFTFTRGHRRMVTQAKDASQVVLQDLTFAPGGHTGWHSHPGPVVITVKTGTLTYYDGTGRCVGHVYPAGTSFIDPGGRVHIARNEGTVPATTSVVYFGVPPDGLPRIDEPAPGNCPF